MDDSLRFSDSRLMLNQENDLASIFLPGAAETEQLGRAIGSALRAGDVVLLYGPVGAGKTTLVRAAISDRIGYSEDIPSPTFTLVQVYSADEQIWHSDLYRLTDTDEIIELGLDEAFADSIVFVEWPDRLGSLRPTRYLAVTLSRDGDGRRADVSFVGEGWAHIDAILKGDFFE